MWEKIVLVIEKKFWNSRLKDENVQNFLDRLNNLFKQWKVRTILVTECFFNLFLEINYYYNWKKMLGFINMQEKLENQLFPKTLKGDSTQMSNFPFISNL